MKRYMTLMFALIVTSWLFMDELARGGDAAERRGPWW